MDFDFIKDSSLRKKIEDSVEYIFALYEETEKGEKNELFKTETYRVIMLYTISIMEAVLLYIHASRKNHIEKEEYKEKLLLPEAFVHRGVESSQLVVVAVKKTKKKEIEIGFQELVKFLQSESVILPKTAEKMLRINDTRNTFHLQKERVVTCTIAHVEEALDLLLYVLSNAPKSISK